MHDSPIESRDGLAEVLRTADQPPAKKNPVEESVGEEEQLEGMNQLRIFQLK